MSKISTVFSLSKDGIDGAIVADTAIGKFQQDCLLIGFVIQSTAGSPSGDGIYRLKCSGNNLATTNGGSGLSGSNNKVCGFGTDTNASVYLLQANAVIPANTDIVFSVVSADTGSVTLNAIAILLPL